MEADFEMQKNRKIRAICNVAEFIVTAPREPVEPMSIHR
jgi:hypothetical protein